MTTGAIVCGDVAASRFERLDGKGGSASDRSDLQSHCPCHRDQFIEGRARCTVDEEGPHGGTLPRYQPGFMHGPRFIPLDPVRDVEEGVGADVGEVRGRVAGTRIRDPAVTDVPERERDELVDPDLGGDRSREFHGNSRILHGRRKPP
jgi:hypothetical protein